MSVGEFELSRCFLETGDGRRSIDHLFPSEKQSIREEQRGVNYSTLRCSSRLPPLEYSAIPPSPKHDSLHSKFFPEVRFRLRHSRDKCRYVPQRWPCGARQSGENVRRGNVRIVAIEPPNAKWPENHLLLEQNLVYQAPYYEVKEAHHQIPRLRCLLATRWVFLLLVMQLLLLFFFFFLTMMMVLLLPPRSLLPSTFPLSNVVVLPSSSSSTTIVSKPTCTGSVCTSMTGAMVVVVVTEITSSSSSPGKFPPKSKKSSSTREDTADGVAGRGDSDSNFCCCCCGCSKAIRCSTFLGDCRISPRLSRSSSFSF